MSIRIMTKVWETKLDNPVTKLILLKLADNASDEGVCFPSIKTVAAHCCCSTRTVYRQIKLLAEMGLIEVDRRKRPNGSTASNQYVVKPGCQKVTPPVTDSHPPGDTLSPPDIGDDTLSPLETNNRQVNQRARKSRTAHARSGVIVGIKIGSDWTNRPKDVQDADQFQNWAEKILNSGKVSDVVYAEKR